MFVIQHIAQLCVITLQVSRILFFRVTHHVERSDLLHSLSKDL